MAQYRKKPVVIEAIQWTGENPKIMSAFMRECDYSHVEGQGILIIHTLEGDHQANPGDMIIKGVSGEFYPCKPDIFRETYDLV